MSKGLQGHRTLAGAAIAIFLLMGWAPPLYAQSRGSVPDEKFYVSLEAGGSRFQRSKDFVFGTAGSDAACNPDPFIFIPYCGPRDDLRHPLEGWGGAGGLTAGYWLTNRVAIDLGFSMAQQTTQTLQSFDQVEGHALFPIIDGSRIGTDQTVFFGFNTPVAVPPGMAKLTYQQTFFDVHLDGRFRLWETKDRSSSLDGVVGFAYLHLDQDFSHQVTGLYNTSPPTPTPLSTRIDLADNLYGIRVGLRGQYGLWRRLKLSASLFGDLYYRTSDLDAKQSAPTAGSSDGTLGAVNATVNDSDSGFVPRLEASVNLTYDLTAKWRVGVIYNFDALRYMSRPETPGVVVVVGDVTTAIDHTLRIRDDDTLLRHFVGLQLTAKF